MTIKHSIESMSLQRGARRLVRQILGHNPPAVELVSLHVPKAAGTSFRKVLQAVYGAKAVWADYSQFVEDTGTLYHRAPERAQRLALDNLGGLPGGVRVVHGHFPLGKYALLPPGVNRITWLRHPVARLVSHYYFWLTTEPHGNPVHDQLLDRKLSIAEFARLPQMRDFMLNNLFLGSDIDSLRFVGMQEYYEQDLAELAWLLEWPDYPQVRSNSGRLEGYGQRLAEIAADEALIGELVLLNKGDMALYRRIAAAKGRRVPDNPWQAW